MHFPPFLSILMAPLVKIFGTDFPGRFLCVLLASLNGALFPTLLYTVHRRRLIPVPPATAVPITLFYLFGTVHFYCAVASNPWELAHVVCNVLVLAALIRAFSESFYCWPSTMPASTTSSRTASAINGCMGGRSVR